MNSSRAKCEQLAAALQRAGVRAEPYHAGMPDRAQRQEAFLADSAEEARTLALAKHPMEKGIFLEYVVPPRGPRFYGSRECSSAESGQPVPTA